MRGRLTIDLTAIARNWSDLDGLTPGAETAAAVKANGYGCGLSGVSGALWAAGCRTFFVATPDEGVTLRNVLEDADIYVLNGFSSGDSEAFSAANLKPVLNDLGMVEAWRAAGAGACALQLDSGMARLGLELRDIETCAKDRRVLEGLGIDTVMSHLACADTPDHDLNIAQLAAFESATEGLRLNARRSLSATGGALLGRSYRFDMVRCGIGLYGGLPFTGASPVVTLEVPILQIRTIGAGAPVGYGASWSAKRISRIATVAAGYADGVIRAASNSGVAYLAGHPAGHPVPFAGRVSMDLITLDVTDAPQAQVGDMVEILGPNQSVDALATSAGTIGYEILTSLGTRYERRYKGASEA